VAVAIRGRSDPDCHPRLDGAEQEQQGPGDHGDAEAGKAGVPEPVRGRRLPGSEVAHRGVESRHCEEGVGQEMEAVGRHALERRAVEQLDRGDLVCREHQGQAESKDHERDAPGSGRGEERQRGTHQEQVRQGEAQALAREEWVEAGGHRQRTQHVGP
jgi:hypothetical protein